MSDVAIFCGSAIPRVLMVSLAITVLLVSCRPNRTARVSSSARGLARDELQLAAVSLKGWWEEDDRPLWNDRAQWTGSAGVVQLHKDRLILVTNSHCLNLRALAESDLDGCPEVIDFGLEAHFFSGKKARVLRFAEIREPLDLALLEVEAAGLVEKRDFVLLPYRAQPDPRAGDEVCAVGAPMGLELRGTLTFGRISAIREKDLMTGEKCRILQIDAPINPGNSGGPLMRESSGRWYWVGVNSSKVMALGVEGIGFAISAGELLDALRRFEWFNCDKHGAAQACNRIYGKHAHAR